MNGDPCRREDRALLIRQFPGMHEGDQGEIGRVTAQQQGFMDATSAAACKGHLASPYLIGVADWAVAKTAVLDGLLAVRQGQWWWHVLGSRCQQHALSLVPAPVCQDSCEAFAADRSICSTRSRMISRAIPLGLDAHAGDEI